MLIRDILLEYDRTRAAQALGPNLWKAALRDRHGLHGVSLDGLEGYGSGVLGRSSGVLTDIIADAFKTPARQRELADNALAKIEAADPSTNKKYTQWMARQFANGSERALEDVTSTLADYVAKFHKLNTRKKLPPGENDINRYKSAAHLYQVMDRYEDPVDDDDGKGKARKEYEDADVTVVVPEDEAAACRYGRQTRWCTAAVHGSNYFNEYNKDGPLYILIPKHPKTEGEKYQLHFDSYQYMDRNDDPVDLGWVLGTRFPGLLKHFLGDPKVGAELRGMVQFTDDATLQGISDQIWDIAGDRVNDILADWEANDHTYYDWLKEEGYVNDDGDVDWDRAPSFTEYNSEAADWYDTMEGLIHPSPDGLRRMVADIDSNGSGYDEEFRGSVYNLESYIADAVRNAFRRSGYGDEMSDWIDKNIRIVRTSKGPRVERMRRDAHGRLLP